MNVQVVPSIKEDYQTLNISEKNKSTPELYYTVLKYFAKFTQFLAWPIAFVFFNSLFNLKINGKENIRNIQSPFIVISNHVSFYDSFVFRLVLGVFAKNLPLRFMAVNSFSSWYLNLFAKLFITDIVYALFGVFVIIKGRGIDKNLEDAVRIIKNGGNVVIYPEGSIIHDEKIADFKQGAAVLAKKTNVPVVPVSFKISGNLLRRDFIINVGRDIKYKDYLSTKEITNIFHNTVEKLYRSNN